jgi:hypothetical protein
MKNILFCLIGLFAIRQLRAQNELDVFRYSDPWITGSVRSMGMSGAFGAVGADPSSAFNNPAGIGVYKTGVIDAGARLALGFQNSNWNSQSSATGNVNLPVDHLTYVRNRPIPSGPWKYWNTALTYGVTQLYSRNVLTNISTSNNSLLDQFAAYANGINYNDVTNAFPFDAGLAWNTYGIDTIPGTVDEYWSNYSGGDNKIKQDNAVAGKTWEANYSVAANLKNQLYVGGNIGLQGVSYSYDLIHTEQFQNPGDTLRDFKYTQNLSATGTSLLMRLGAIYQPELIPWWKIGVSWTSGRRTRFTDTFESAMTTNFYSSSLEATSPKNSIDYVIISPAMWQLSSAMNLGDRMLWTLDADFINMKKGGIEPAGDLKYNYASENKQVKDSGKNVQRLKTGIEYRISQQFLLRGGVGYQTAPFADAKGKLSVSAGLGYHTTNVFLESGLMVLHSGQTENVYDPRLIQPTQVNQTQVMLGFSIGWRISEPVDRSDEYAEPYKPYNPPAKSDPF